MPRCGRRCLWLPARLLLRQTMAPSGPRPTSRRVKRPKLLWTVQLNPKCSVLNSIAGIHQWHSCAPGYSEPSPSVCKPYPVCVLPPEEASPAAAVAEVTVNGMDPSDPGFPPTEVTTAGQSHFASRPQEEWQNCSTKDYNSLVTARSFWCSLQMFFFSSFKWTPRWRPSSPSPQRTCGRYSRKSWSSTSLGEFPINAYKYRAWQDRTYSPCFLIVTCVTPHFWFV